MRHLLTRQLASSQQQLLWKAAWENLSSIAYFQVVVVFWNFHESQISYFGRFHKAACSLRVQRGGQPRKSATERKLMKKNCNTPPPLPPNCVVLRVKKWQISDLLPHIAYRCVIWIFIDRWHAIKNLFQSGDNQQFQNNVTSVYLCLSLPVSCSLEGSIT